VKFEGFSCAFLDMCVPVCLLPFPLDFSAVEEQDPVERFVGIMRFFLGGWHVRPKVCLLVLPIAIFLVTSPLFVHLWWARE